MFAIVLSWNRPETVSECLRGLRESDYPQLRVVVVDNASADDSPARLKRRFSDIAVLQNAANLGYTGGCNVGIRYALNNGADFVWLVNDDVIVETSTLSTLIREFQQVQNLGLLSPIVFYHSDPTLVQFNGTYLDYRCQCVGIPSGSSNAKSELMLVLTGAALLVSARVFHSIGMFDDRFFAYWEDFDLSIRAAKAGFRLGVCNTARVFHKTPLPSDTSVVRPPHFYFYMVRNEFFFWYRNLKGWRRITYPARFFASAIEEAAMCAHRGGRDASIACLDGAWSALSGATGNWVNKRAVPARITQILMWHPHMWSALIRGDLGLITKRLLLWMNRKLIDR